MLERLFLEEGRRGGEGLKKGLKGRWVGDCGNGGFWCRLRNSRRNSPLSTKIEREKRMGENTPFPYAARNQNVSPPPLNSSVL